MRKYLASLLDKLGKKLGLDIKFFAHQGIFVNLGYGITTIMGFITSLVLTTYLTKKDYGLYIFVISVMNILSLTCLTGMAGAMTQSAAVGFFSSLNRGLRYTLKWSKLGLSAVIIASVFFYLTGKTIVAVLLLLAIPYLYSNGVLIDSVYFLLGLKRFDRVSLHFTRIYSGSAIGAILGALLTKNLIWTFIGFVLVHFIATLFAYIDARSFVKPSPIDEGLFSYAKELTVNSSVIQIITENIDKLLIAHFIGLTEVAIYSVAYILPGSAYSLFKSNFQMILPKLAKDLKEIKFGFVVKKLGLLSLLVIPFSLVVLVATRLILPILYPSYTGSIHLGTIMSLSLILYAANLFITHIFTARKFSRCLLRYQIFLSITYFMFLGWLAPLFGSLGILYSIAASKSLSLIYGLYVLNKELQCQTFA